MAHVSQNELLISAFCILVYNDRSSNDPVQQHWCYWEIRVATWGGLYGLPGLWWWFPAPAHYSNTVQKASGALWSWSRVLAPCFPLTSDLSGA